MIIDINDYIEEIEKPVEGFLHEIVTKYEKSPLEQQFDVMRELVEDHGDVRTAFIAMTDLIKMFYYYLEGKKL